MGFGILRQRSYPSSKHFQMKTSFKQPLLIILVLAVGCAIAGCNKAKSKDANLSQEEKLEKAFKSIEFIRENIFQDYKAYDASTKKELMLLSSKARLSKGDTLLISSRAYVVESIEISFSPSLITEFLEKFEKKDMHLDGGRLMEGKKYYSGPIKIYVSAKGPRKEQ